MYENRRATKYAAYKLTILDAGTGPGQTIGWLVDRVIEAGKSSRIISVDHNQGALDKMRKELGDKEACLATTMTPMRGRAIAFNRSGL